ncbi:hypothetical protein GCM10023205_48140 [Yinghuangia aomiensis]|uniref:Uncharacterized protein n=1 Tax=Yinghuangia aomiensis TaxID=676205 RepID=A0ABP9HQD7_9ACTN
MLRAAPTDRGVRPVFAQRQIAARRTLPPGVRHPRPNLTTAHRHARTPHKEPTPEPVGTPASQATHARHTPDPRLTTAHRHAPSTRAPHTRNRREKPLPLRVTGVDG